MATDGPGPATSLWLWIGGPPRVALIGAALWCVLGVPVVVAGGDPGAIVVPALILLVIASGARARRRSQRSIGS